MYCPNINSKDYKDLEKSVGKITAHFLWDKFQGEVPEKYYNNFSKEQLKDKASPYNIPDLEILAKLYNINIKGFNLMEDSVFQSVLDRVNEKIESGFNPYKNTEDEIEVKDWFAENLPQFPRNVVYQIIDLNGNKVDAHGAFFNNVIQVMKNAQKGTSYHEAFHAVFRNILNQKEADELISEAQDKYGLPTEKELNKLKKLYSKEGKDLSSIENNAFVLLWLEEKMADDFADYVLYPLGRKQDTIWTKIANFFKSILEFFNLATNKKVSKIEQVFKNINTSKYAKTKFGNSKVSSQVDEILGVERYSRVKKIDGFPANQKLQRSKAIANKFKDIYLSKIRSGKTVTKGETSKIFDSIFKEYERRLQEAYSEYLLDKNNQSKLDKVGTLAPLVRQEVKEALLFEARKILKDEGININGEFVFQEVTDSNFEFENEGILQTITSQTTKGLGDYTSIPGMNHASGRMKLALSIVPKLDNQGQPARDNAGDVIYMDMKAVYYYLEQNLIDLYTFEKKLDEIARLTEFFPELSHVTDMLTSATIHGSEEALLLFQNDFNTNFNKQQLKFDLVIYDGKKVKIINANRRDLYKEIKSEWETNLLRSDKSTIAEFDKSKDSWITRNTQKAIVLAEKWSSLLENPDAITVKNIRDVLNSLGIELETSTLENLFKNDSKELFRHIENILIYRAREGTTTKIEGAYNKAFNYLIKSEIQHQLNLFTSSFNDAENKNIYTIQLPSMLSRMIAKFKKSSEEEFTVYLNDLMQDSIYRHSNLLQKLVKKPALRHDFLNLSFIDGLKKEYAKKGSKFMDLNNRDFYFLDLALNANSAQNKKEGVSTLASKHIYLTNSDKKLQTVLTAPIYSVSIDTDGNPTRESSNYHNTLRNIATGEIARLKDAIEFKKKYQAGEYTNEDVIEHYHVQINKGFDENNKAIFNGNAFKFHYLEFLNDEVFIKKIIKTIEDNPNKTVEEIVSDHTLEIDSLNTDFLQDLVEKQLRDLVKKGIISKLEDGSYIDVSLPEGFVTESKIHKTKDSQLRFSVASYTLNKFVNNVELSQLFNGDTATYKPGDLTKRTYQSNSATSQGDTTGTLKVSVIKDIVFTDKNPSILRQQLIENLSKNIYISKEEREHLISQFDETSAINDASSYILPSAWKKELESRGQWNDDLQLAYDIGEGLLVDDDNNTREATKEEKERARGKLITLKPMGYGLEFNDKLKKWFPVQYKTAILPIFDTLIEGNELLKQAKKDAIKNEFDLVISESTLKGFIPFRQDVTDDVELTKSFEISRENFGIQVDNVQHMVDEENNAQRQIKMIMHGVIDPEVTYTLKNEKIEGNELFEHLAALESTNIKEDADILTEKIEDKDTEFLIDLAEGLSKRNATDVTYKIFETIGTDFKYPLYFGPYNIQAQNMIASRWTNNIAKQSFPGGSVVAVSSMGYQYTTDEETQKLVDANPRLKKAQSTLTYKWDNNGRLLYVEAAMPAWSNEFFDSNGDLIDINNIPDELRTFLTYRIPTEWAHSIVPIKVVKFIDGTAGNMMLLPTDITTILGEDFDFDKRYFSYKHFFRLQDKDTLKYSFIIPRYSAETRKTSVEKRYELYKKSRNEQLNKLISKAKALGFNEGVVKAMELEQKIASFEQFENWSIEKQNTREARDNRILDIYTSVLTDPTTLKSLLTKSNFDKLEEIKQSVVKEEEKYGVSEEKTSFYSAQNQNETKVRNAAGNDLKGQAALHITAHAYFTKMGARLKKSISFNSNKKEKGFETSSNLSKLNNSLNEVIGDKVGQVAAAILDDLKNPVLKYINMNNNTIDIYAGLIRLGFQEEDIIDFLRHPAVKRIAESFNDNDSQLKTDTEGLFTFKTAHTQNTNVRESFEKAMPFVLSGTLEYEKGIVEAIADRKMSPALFTKDYNFQTFKEGKTYNSTIRGLKNNRIFYFENKQLLDEIQSNPTKIKDLISKYSLDYKTIEDVYKYLLDQEKVTYAYENFKAIGDALVKVNRYFALNKELGPDIETVKEKLNLYVEIFQDEKFPIHFERDNPVMEAIRYAAEKEMDYFRNHYPYDTTTYDNIKTKVAQQQLISTASEETEISVPKQTIINKLSHDQRTKINKFTDLYMSYKSDLFKDSLNPSEVSRILKEVPEKLLEYKAIRNIEQYGDLRNTPMFSLLKSDTNKKINFKTIKFKANRSDVSTKNAFTNTMQDLFDNDEYRGFIIDLIKYSHISSGFQTGLDSFHTIIDPDILSELGLDEDMRKLIYLLTNDKEINSTLDTNTNENFEGSLNNAEIEHLTDLMVRNNSELFTKVIKSTSGEKLTVGERTTFTIDSSKIDTRSESQLIIGKVKVNDIYVPVYSKYVRVKTYYPDLGISSTELYKQTSLEESEIKTYERVSFLGKAGYLIEIYNPEQSDKSYIGANNYGLNTLNNEAQEEDEINDDDIYIQGETNKKIPEHFDSVPKIASVHENIGIPNIEKSKDNPPIEGEEKCN